MTAQHNQQGLARPCNGWDLFAITGGLQCGNCLAVFPSEVPPLKEEELTLAQQLWLRDVEKREECCGN